VVEIAAPHSPPQRRAEVLEHAAGFHRPATGDDRVDHPVNVAAVQLGKGRAPITGSTFLLSRRSMAARCEGSA
jgi:hypothetical protein